MPILPREQPEPSPAPPEESQRMATSFGVHAQRYDQARPGYPEALVARILAGTPGAGVLDVGCGTGIAARQFQAAGCTVLGIEPDARMADFARARGLQVEVATFEAWEPGDRMFDAVIAAQSWHWVDPVAGTAKVAGVLRPGGRLAIFGHVYEPPAEVAEPFAAAYRRVAPDSPISGQPARRPLELYQAGYAKIADQICETERFRDPEQWRFDWQQPYTRDQWLELLPTTGGLTRLHPDQLAEILDAVGNAIDSLGGSFTMDYTTLAATAARTNTP
ncbi:class I SAM-dependent methyltransferase [Nocardia donostiensis]|uniref:SAM-dependent methyltransferase n=1 Tax=Nocardia donostiensis TaxID=1538463 RepID=A0A1W0B1J7_9NOCA|nr:class I SAM-dependent methyltransferase [Nocardia donostiensis]ONM46380.1 SAM-dependent methyltransferase [Nocardia donostiensis]OQS16327.1 SAM-dependent methyltransferase [Nocardia donostiensis]OQS16461.1 SAM-dependent methyltransferase [Nocardia donostiensis]